jgi:hypothetical protein
MGFTNDYKPDYDEDSEALKAGEYKAAILEAYVDKSNSGKQMIKVILAIRGKKFFWYLVEGDWFNANCTRFFVCFSIKAGNFDYGTWKGKTGKVEIDRDERNSKYFRITSLVPPEAGNSGAPHERPPAQNDEDKFSDDIPF